MFNFNFFNFGIFIVAAVSPFSSVGSVQGVLPSYRYARGGPSGSALVRPFLYFDHFHIFDPFCTSTHRLYFDFFVTTLLRPKLYFDLCFSTIRPVLLDLLNKKSRFGKRSKYRKGRTNAYPVQVHSMDNYEQHIPCAIVENLTVSNTRVFQRLDKKYIKKSIHKYRFSTNKSLTYIILTSPCQAYYNVY